MGVSNFLNKLEHVKDYSVFLMQKYWDEREGEKRFNQLTPDVVKNILTKENILLATTEVNRNWPKIKESLEPISKKKVVDDVKWVKEHNFPEKLLETPNTLAFFRDSKIYGHMKYYHHALQTENDKLGLVVEGEFMSLEQIVEKFILVKEGNNVQIIEKSTNKHYYYLEMGLVEYNPQKEIQPVRSLLPEETPSEHKLTFYCVKEGHTNSASGVKRWDRHVYIGLKTPDAQQYIIGALPEGVSSPDRYCFIQKKHEEVEFSISKSEFQEIINMASVEQKEHKDFNMLFRNCSSFGGRVAQQLHIPASPVTRIEDHDNLEHRVKAYAFSKEIVKEIKNQAAKDEFSDTAPEIIFTNTLKILLENKDVEASTKVILITLLKTNETLIKGQIRGVIQEIKNEGEVTLTEKMYNLVTDIYSTTKGMEISHPNVFSEQLDKYKDQKNLDEKITQIYLRFMSASG